MSTSRTIDNLNIRKFSNKAAFDSATIGEDDICVLLDDGTPLMYTTTLPEPSASVVNAVYYLISDYQGQAGWYQGQRIYKCVFDGSNYYWSSLYTQENPNYGSYYHEVLTVSSTRTAFRFAYSSSLPLGGCVVQISDGMDSDFVAVIVGDAGVYRQTTIKATGAFEGMRLGTYKTSTTSTNRYYILNKKDNSTFFDSSTRVTYTVIGLGNDVNSYQACRLTSITIGSTVTETRTWFEEIGGSQTPDMPEITPDILGQTRQYTGATDSTYTNGYFYKATGTEVNTPAVMATTITSPSGEATVDIDATSFIRNFCNWVGWSVAELERALINYAQQTWIINYSIDNAQVVEVYVPFYGWVGATSITQCFAVTYTGSLSSGNVDINFTIAYTPAEHTVQDGVWERVDVQPNSGGGSYTAGNGISIDANNEISVADPVLVNKATGTDSITIGGGSGYPSAQHNIVVGSWATVGYNQYSSSRGNIVVGDSARMRNGNNNIVIGYNAGDSTPNSGDNSIAIGTGAKYGANYAIQLGGNNQTNSDANTFKVGNANGNFEIMSANGTVPTARLTKVNTTVTLAVADWSSNTQTVNVTGMTADGVVLVNPTPANQSAYTDAGILCTAQAAGSLTFTCDTVPSADIVVTVVML